MRTLGPEQQRVLNLYLSELERSPLLSEEEERQLVEQAHAGDLSARERLICANLRLVVREAKRYVRICGVSGFLDLIQAGNVGLICAADRVDPSFNNRFTTYAGNWIKQQILLTLKDQGNLIHLPPKQFWTALRIERAERKLAQESCEEPTLLAVAQEAEVPVDQCAFLRRVRLGEVSLSTPLFAGGDQCHETLESNIADEAAESARESTEKELFASAFEKAFEVLTDRETEVIRLRFGFDGEESLTLEEIGSRSGVTREAVRRTEMRALAKLRKFLKTNFALEYV